MFICLYVYTSNQWEWEQLRFCSLGKIVKSSLMFMEGSMRLCSIGDYKVHTNIRWHLIKRHHNSREMIRVWKVGRFRGWERRIRGRESFF